MPYGMHTILDNIKSNEIFFGWDTTKDWCPENPNGSNAATQFWLQYALSDFGDVIVNGLDMNVDVCEMYSLNTD